ncbi:uncharacterized protein LOC123705455 isoform X1 [Colias croceus]|uniref:uncharacterized protein LOC123705455 isoform X1 n=1 Tax=Colias crocea TaxID=72248 RepID=UPI001E27C5FE|nr:uncharacterized protein LOC123705455 isoform X1 [Colias croceus]
MCETNRKKIKLLVVIAFTTAQSFPIYNGFSVNFTPMLNKEEVKPKTFGSLFAKIPQELPNSAQENLSQAIFSNVGYLGAGCTNQIAKILFPTKSSPNSLDNITSWTNGNFINIPILKQPVNDYKILIAAAPPNVKINKADDSRPLLVYIVFPNEDNSTDVAKMSIPTVYFVNKVKGVMDMETKSRLDPVLLVDHNRTVTKLKSREIAKFVKFKNKKINHFD